MALSGALAAQLSGERLAHGSFTPTAASTAIATGLESIRAAVVGFGGLPTQTHIITYCTWSGATLTVVCLKPTAVNDVTLIDATTPWSVVEWFAVGQGAR